MQTQALTFAREVSTNTAALTFLKTNMNLGLHTLEAELGTQYYEDIRTGATKADASNPNRIILPQNCIRPKALYVTIGTRQVPATEIFDEETWRLTQMNASVTSNELEFFFVRRNWIEIYPTPSSALTYTLIYEAESKDLANDDYTTGTITTLTNGAAAVTGSSTVFTAGMIGRYFKIDADGEWYEIATRSSNTAITLVRLFQGTSIAAGTSAYTIGEMPRTPGPTHIIPCYYAAWQYYQGYKKDEKFAAIYERLYNNSMKWAKTTYERRFSTMVIPDQSAVRSRVANSNPNWNPRNVT